MKKIILFLITLIPINIIASTSSYIVMDGDSGRVISSYNKDEKMLIASTTKIMTSIIALENMDKSIIIEVGDEIDRVYYMVLCLEVAMMQQ